MTRPPPKAEISSVFSACFVRGGGSGRPVRMRRAVRNIGEIFALVRIFSNFAH